MSSPPRTWPRKLAIPPAPAWAAAKACSSATGSNWSVSRRTYTGISTATDRGQEGDLVAIGEPLARAIGDQRAVDRDPHPRRAHLARERGLERGYQRIEIGLAGHLHLGCAGDILKPAQE